MGDIADYYMDLAMHADFEKDFYHKDNSANIEYYNLKEKRWLQKTGEFIEVSKMTPQHRDNTIRAIKENRIKLHYPKDWTKLLNKSPK